MGDKDTVKFIIMALKNKGYEIVYLEAFNCYQITQNHIEYLLNESECMDLIQSNENHPVSLPEHRSENILEGYSF